LTLQQFPIIYLRSMSINSDLIVIHGAFNEVVFAGLD
jgi:hypothetical protein